MKDLNKDLVKNLISSIIKENSLTDKEIDECGAGCCGTTTADLGPAVQYIGAKKKDKKEFLDFGTTKVDGDNNIIGDNNTENESTLQEDDLDEMSRGIRAPQETARREYIAEYPDSNIKTADQFIRKVINNPEAPGHDKYKQRLATLIRTSPMSSLSDIAANIELDNEEGSDDENLMSTYTNAVLGHRKDMSKSNYHSHGVLNAYGRDVRKRKPNEVSVPNFIKDIMVNHDNSEGNSSAVLNNYLNSNTFDSFSLEKKKQVLAQLLKKGENGEWDMTNEDEDIIKNSISKIFS